MIDSVRNTVLSILNKNNYGYISPADFNLYAKQAQLEIFDGYIAKYNNVINLQNARRSGTEYGDALKKASEDMEIFSVEGFLSNSSSNVFLAPSAATTGYDYYMINKILCYTDILASGNNTSVSSGYLVASGAAFQTAGVKVGDIVVNKATGNIAYVSAITSQTQLQLTSNIFTTSPVAYAVISISVFREVEKVSHSVISKLNMSNLTKPNKYFPAYTLQGPNITVYPNTVNTKGQVLAQYFRYPIDPKWTYVSLTGGEPVFNQSQPDYRDFEVPQEEEYKLVVKILQYCGLSIRETEVVQYAKQQEIDNNAK